MSLSHGLKVLVALALVAVASAVKANVVYSDTVLVKAPEFAAVFELPTASAPSNYRVTATDLNWLGAPLQALSFGVFTATSQVKSRSGAGTLEFFYAGTDKLFLQLYARTAPLKSAGLVGLQADCVTVVPLPASFWLLLSALGAAGAWRWRWRGIAPFHRAATAASM